MIATNSSCRCTRTLPSELQKLNYTDCLKGGKGVAMFYQHYGELLHYNSYALQLAGHGTGL